MMTIEHIRKRILTKTAVLSRSIRLASALSAHRIAVTCKQTHETARTSFYYEAKHRSTLIARHFHPLLMCEFEYKTRCSMPYRCCRLL